MNALDLSKMPPRGPRTPLAGLDLIMAARTVDKVRASLPETPLIDMLSKDDELAFYGAR